MILSFSFEGCFCILRFKDLKCAPRSLCASSAEELFIISRLSRSAERSKRYFHRRGRNRKTAFAAPLSAKARRCGWRPRPLRQFASLTATLPLLSLRDISPRPGRVSPRGRLNSLSQNLTVLPAPSGREPLAWRKSFQPNRKACGRARSPLGELSRSD